MEKLYIICVDDQREVLHNITRDLRILNDWTVIEECESAMEAQELLEDLTTDGLPVALVICDHIMPEISGVEFLSSLEIKNYPPHLKKILLTGQASHKDTIDAINRAHIDYYIEKPWNSEILQDICRKLLTEYLFDTGRYNNEFRTVADSRVLLERMR